MYIISYFSSSPDNYLKKNISCLDEIHQLLAKLTDKKINLESLGNASAPIETIINDPAKTITRHRPF